MDFNFEITPGGSSVPPGLYRATFERAEEFVHEEHGPGAKWVFRVCDGEHSGEEASRITGPEPKPKNACGRMVGWLSGESPSVGLKLDYEACVGREYMLVIEDSPGGNGTRIATVMPRDA